MGSYGTYQYYRNKPKIPISVEFLLPGEVFRPITSDELPGVYDYYQISNCGRVYHNYLGRCLKPSLDNGGYPFVVLSTVNGPKTVNVHRIEMLAFLPMVFGDKIRDINHIDGNKQNPNLTNLEIISHSANIKHAYDNGLHSTGEDLSFTKITNAQAQEIVSLLDQKIPNVEIARRLNVPCHIVDSIKKKESWTRFSEGHDFEQRPGRLFTEEMVHNICRYFSSAPFIPFNRNEFCRQALRACGYDDSPRYVETVRKILGRKYYPHITSQYNF